MPFPAPELVTLPQVKAWGRITSDTDDAALQLVVDAVVDLVKGLPIAQRSNTDPAPADWPDAVRMGAVMLAARVWRRRNTPGGVESAGDFGVAYVRRTDPDIAQMLELGDYSRPGVG